MLEYHKKRQKVRSQIIEQDLQIINVSLNVKYVILFTHNLSFLHWNVIIDFAKNAFKVTIY